LFSSIAKAPITSLFLSRHNLSKAKTHPKKIFQINSVVNDRSNLIKRNFSEASEPAPKEEIITGTKVQKVAEAHCVPEGSVGDCLMSQNNDLDQEFSLLEGQIGDDDQYQFEEVIKQKLDQITDLK